LSNELLTATEININKSTGSRLTFDQESLIKSTVVVLSGAGLPAVHGDYHFASFKNDAGCYIRTGFYDDEIVQFAICKWNTKNGGFQWYLSITPSPSSSASTSTTATQDVDLYCSTAKASDLLPPKHHWTCLVAGFDVAASPTISLLLLPGGEDPVEDDAATTATGMMGLTAGESGGYGDSDSDSEQFYGDPNTSGYGVEDSFTSLYSDNE
jgi:hypothetical protein